MEMISNINNTAVYRDPAPQSPLQGPNVMQPPVVYSKIMLRTIELAESDYTFDGLAVERTMPSNNGSNEIMFKRMLSLAAHTQPLAEGIPPASDQGRMVAIKASTKSYGRVMKFTDKVNWAVVDPLISEYTRQLSLKIPETKDILAQEALLTECQSYYACIKEPDTNDSDILKPVANGTVNHITKLTPDCAPTIDEFRKIVLSMEAAKVRPYQGANFLVLASSAVLFDLITDKRVKEFMKYENTGKAYSTDMVIDLFSLAFKKAKTIKTDNSFTDADGVVRYIYHAPSVAFTAAVTTVGSEADAVPDGFSGASDYSGAINFLLPRPIAEMADDDTDDCTVIYLKKSGSSYVHGTNDTVEWADLKSALSGADYDVLNIHHTFVLGEECLFRIGVEGHTAPQFITKPLGSAGTEDPLNQRQSIGWKIDSLGYKVPNPDAVVDYMCCPTQYKVNVNARPDLKNQFTDYYYGYMDANGQYYHPEQVMQTVENGAVKFYVRGTTTEVTAVKMTQLVKPVKTGRVDSNGNRPVVKGHVPTMKYALSSDHSITFAADQVEKYATSDTANPTFGYFIKGCCTNGSTYSGKVGVSAAAVIAIEPNGVTYTSTEFKADGTGVEDKTAIVEHGDVNLTGDPTVDNK